MSRCKVACIVYRYRSDNQDRTEMRSRSIRIFQSPWTSPLWSLFLGYGWVTGRLKCSPVTVLLLSGLFILFAFLDFLLILFFWFFDGFFRLIIRWLFVFRLLPFFYLAVWFVRFTRRRRFAFFWFAGFSCLASAMRWHLDSILSFVSINPVAVSCSRACGPGLSFAGSCVNISTKH